jgi:hypothetical protein
MFVQRGWTDFFKSPYIEVLGPERQIAQRAEYLVLALDIR